MTIILIIKKKKRKTTKIYNKVKVKITLNIIKKIIVTRKLQKIESSYM